MAEATPITWHDLFWTIEGWVALGTLAVVLTAVGLQAWIHWQEGRRHPRLTPSFDEHLYQEESNPRTGATVPYLRLAVGNAVGKHAARSVEVLLLDVEEVGGGGVKRWLVNPALAWANSLDRLPVMTIPAGSTRYVDVGCWIQEASSTVAGLTFMLTVVPLPGSGRNLLPAGHYRMKIAVATQNGDAETWILDVSFEEHYEHGLAMPRNLTASVAKV